MNKLLVVPLLLLPAWASANKDLDIGHWYLEGAYTQSELKDARSVISLPSNSSGNCADVVPALLPGPLGCDVTIPGVLTLFPSTATLGPGGSQTFTTEYDEGDGFEVSLGYDFPGAFRLELSFVDFENDVDRVDNVPTTATLESRQLMGNFWLDFNEGGVVQPYIGLGVGATQLDLDEADDTITTAQAGVGLNFALGSHVKLNLGYRYFEGRDAEFEGSANDFVTEYSGQRLLLGLRFDFLRDPPIPPDSDGDGVENDRDQCPNTPREARVDAQGCPLDSDGDGVHDYRDQCPGTPVGTEVDARGCSLDSDGDGVVNSADECPKTPRGRRVLENGCESIVLQGVNFESGSTILTPAAREVCRDVARKLDRARGINVELQGHTDSVGSADFNQQLSLGRAEAVRSCLIQNGVAASRLTARGYGEYRPVASNISPEGRARNRRTEMQIVNN